MTVNGETPPNSIVESQKGYQDVIDDVQRCVSLPLVGSHEVQAVDSRPYGPNDMPLGNETILLVEDEASLRIVLSEVLREQGYSVLEASNGVEAISVAQSYDGGQIDLLLTDMVMPLMGGKQLAENIREFSPQTKVIYTSGYPKESIGITDPTEEDAAFMQKPITPPVLAQKVREALDG